MAKSISLFFFAAVLAADTHTISGRILDPSGAAVAQATVTAVARASGLRGTTRSNDAGEFRITLSGGKWLLEASAAGLASATPEKVELRGDLTRDLVLSLGRVTSVVSVTASGTAQPVDEVAKALDVITTQELDQRGEFSLAEAVRLTPGVRSTQLGGPGAFTSISVRGMRSYQTSVLADGFRLRDTTATQGEASGYLSDILLLDLDRVEILRGSGSSLYGTHSMGGVLNLVTDSGGGPLRGSLVMEGGGLGILRTQGRVSGSAVKDRLRYSAGIGHLNVLRGVDGDDRHRNSSMQGQVQYLAAPRTTLRGRFWISDAFLQLNTTPFAAPEALLPASKVVPANALSAAQVRRAESGLPIDWTGATFAPSLNDPDSRRSARLYNGLGGITQEFAGGASLRIDYQGLATQRDNRDGPAGVRFQPLFSNSNAFDGRLDVLAARVDAPLPGGQLFSGGYEFERERFENVATEQDPQNPLAARTAISQRSQSLFVQDQIRLLESRLLISVSGRWQTFALAAPKFAGGPPAYAAARNPAPPDAFTGDIAAAYFISSTGTKFRAHAGNAYRAPSLFERYGTGFFGGFFSPYGDPRLRPERALGVDVGVDQYLAGSRVRLSASYFYTRLQEVIEFDFSGLIDAATDPFGRFGGYLNTRGGLARGVELSAEARPWPGMSLRSSYTHTNARERNSILQGGSIRTLRVFEHMGTLTATQRLGRSIDATFDFFAASSYLGPFFAGSGTRAFRFEGPRKADLMVQYTRPLSDRTKLQVYTRLENLANQRFFEDGFRTPRFWGVGGVRLLF